MADEQMRRLGLRVNHHTDRMGISLELVDLETGELISNWQEISVVQRAGDMARVVVTYPGLSVPAVCNDAVIRLVAESKADGDVFEQWQAQLCGLCGHPQSAHGKEATPEKWLRHVCSACTHHDERIHAFRPLVKG